MESKKERIIRLHQEGKTLREIAYLEQVSTAWAGYVINPESYQDKVNRKTIKKSQERILHRIRIMLAKDKSFANKVREVLRGG